MATTDVHTLWNDVVEKVKVRLVMPALWRAMESARPLLIENGVLILGFPALVGHEASLLTESKNQNIIERALEESAGGPLRLKVIHGESVQDWEDQKRRDTEAAALQAAATERRRREMAAGQSWEAVAEQLNRRFIETPQRQLPQGQAAFLEHAIGVLAVATGRLMPKAEVPEVEHRAYARALDKVADRAQIPVTLLAWLVQQRLSRP